MQRGLLGPADASTTNMENWGQIHISRPVLDCKRLTGECRGFSLPQGRAMDELEIGEKTWWEARLIDLRDASEKSRIFQNFA
jgi:hypothetical protein